MSKELEELIAKAEMNIPGANVPPRLFGHNQTQYMRDYLMEFVRQYEKIKYNREQEGKEKVFEYYCPT